MQPAEPSKPTQENEATHETAMTINRALEGLAKIHNRQALEAYSF